MKIENIAHSVDYFLNLASCMLGFQTYKGVCSQSVSRFTVAINEDSHYESILSDTKAELTCKRILDMQYVFRI